MMHPKLEQIAKIAYSFKDTVYNTYTLASLLLKKNRAQGDFVECGVAAGAQIMAMQQAILDSQLIINQTPLSPEIWAFDSFEGIPLAGIYDTDQPGIGAITHNAGAAQEERLVSSGITVHSVECVKRNFKQFGYSIENLHFVKGWFQKTLPEYSCKIKDISLLRLDGDLYESTLVCLQHLYEKVVSGGVVIVDDYALPGCKKAIDDYFHSLNQSLPEMILVEGGGGVAYFYKK